MGLSTSSGAGFGPGPADAKTEDTTEPRGPSLLSMAIVLVVIALCVWLIPDWEGNRNGKPVVTEGTTIHQGTLAPPTGPALVDDMTKTVAPPALPEEDK